MKGKRQIWLWHYAINSRVPFPYPISAFHKWRNKFSGDFAEEGTGLYIALQSTQISFNELEVYKALVERTAAEKSHCWGWDGSFSFICHVCMYYLCIWFRKKIMSGLQSRTFSSCGTVLKCRWNFFCLDLEELGARVNSESEPPLVRIADRMAGALTLRCFKDCLKTNKSQTVSSHSS
jgi:hypothetical protein